MRIVIGVPRAAANLVFFLVVTMARKWSLSATFERSSSIRAGDSSSSSLTLSVFLAGVVALLTVSKAL